MNVVIPTVSANVDVSSIQKAVALGIRSTTQKMEKLLLNTAFYTAVKAQQYTPFTSLSTIDQEMEVTVTPIVSAGNNGKTNITSNKKTPFGLTMAQKIVLARMNPNSAYNIATSGRWKIPYQNLRGIGGFYKLEEMAERMIRARHSSTHFLQAGWKSVIQKIKDTGARFSGSSVDALDESTMNTLSVERLGDMTRKGIGTSEQSITIANLIGTEASDYPNLAQEHNDALLSHGTPALQRAVDEQAQDMRDHYLPKVNDELTAEWNSVPDAAPLARSFRPNMIRQAEIQSVYDVESSQDLTAFGSGIV